MVANEENTRPKICSLSLFPLGPCSETRRERGTTGKCHIGALSTINTRCAVEQFLIQDSEIIDAFPLDRIVTASPIV